MEALYRLCYEDIQLKPTAILLGLVLETKIWDYCFADE
jgi:hypothetical protein